MPTELKKELIGGLEYLYECEHITTDTYPGVGVFHLGPSSTIFICRHCWNHIKGMVMEEVLRDILQSELIPATEEVLRGLVKDGAESSKLINPRDVFSAEKVENLRLAR